MDSAVWEDMGKPPVYSSVVTANSSNDHDHSVKTLEQHLEHNMDRSFEPTNQRSRKFGACYWLAGDLES